MHARQLDDEERKYINAQTNKHEIRFRSIFIPPLFKSNRTESLPINEFNL